MGDQFPSRIEFKIDPNFSANCIKVMVFQIFIVFILVFSTISKAWENFGRNFPKNDPKLEKFDRYYGIIVPWY